MNRNGFWVKKNIRTGEVVSLIKVENDYEDYSWDFDLEEFKRLPRIVTDIGMSDDYDKIPEEEALELLGRDSWENE